MAGVKRYDWDAYTDGKIRVIVEGVDTKARVRSVRAQMFVEARDRGLHARTLIVRAGAESWFSAEHDALVFWWTTDPFEVMDIRDALPALRDRVRPHWIEQFPAMFEDA